MIRWLKDLFAPEQLNDLDTAAIGGALNDPGVRSLWLKWCFDEIKTINLEVDKRLLADGTDYSLSNLSARRKALQDVLEAILSARRKLTQEVRPNPRARVEVNLDRVTA